MGTGVTFAASQFAPVPDFPTVSRFLPGGRQLPEWYWPTYSAAMNITFSATLDLLVHLSCFLTFVSFWVKDIVWLRLFSIASSLVWIGFMATPHHLIGASLFWNIVFITVNVVRIVQLLLERAAVEFSEEEAELHRTVFAGLAPVDFHRLLRAGEWQGFATGDTLIACDSPPEALSLLTAGAAEVVKAGRVVATLAPHQFVGELSYLSGKPATATVTATADGRRLVWTRQSLNSLFRLAPTLHHAFHAVVTHDLSAKLIRTT